MKSGVGGGADAVNAAGDPTVEIVFVSNAANAQGSILAGLDRKRLALFETPDVVLMQNGYVALQGFDGAAVVVIVQPETAAAIGLHGEIAAGNAEVVAGRRIDVEGSGALAKDQTRGACAILEREVVKLQDRVFLQESHGAVLELDFGTALVRSEDVSLADGQIQGGGLPRRV